MDSSFPPGESGAKISSTWWLHSPLELLHYLNVPSSRRSSFGSFFTGQPIVVQITFTAIHLTGRSLSLHSTNPRKTGKHSVVICQKRGENRFQRTASVPVESLSPPQQSRFFSSFHKCTLLGSAIPLMSIFSIFPSWSYTSI